MGKGKVVGARVEALPAFGGDEARKTQKST
jgi:hypothetical protein